MLVMSVRANTISNRRRVRRAMQAFGFVVLLLLAVGAVLTASGAFAGKLSASSAKPAYAPIFTDTLTPTSTPNPCDPVWSVVSSPNVDIVNDLYDVAVVSANDVWAVGYYYFDQGRGGFFPLTEHWDGTSWSAVSGPIVDNGFLYGVAAVSANDVWAVGATCSSCSPSQTIVGHWDGTSWSVVPSPNPNTGTNYLYGVAAVSANDVWAVGYSGSSTLIEHWDGTSWSVVGSPSPGAGANILRGITAVSANDVWTVGNAGSQTLVEHWDGSSWSVVSSPNVGSLNRVAAVSANDVWAVGGSTTIHWDGTVWSVVPGPNIGNLTGVAAVSANDVWAVGYSSDSTLIEHWDGTVWSVVGSPSPGGYYLHGIAAASANDVWAVGCFGNCGGYVTAQTLVEHYASLCGTPTSTPTNTPTPSTIINGHLTWQGVAPANRPSVLGSLTLCVNRATQTFPFTTDTGGYFTVTALLPDGTYHWRTKGGKHLASSSPGDGADLVITNGQATLEFGTQRGGNTDSGNIVNSNDFNTFKHEFGLGGIRASDFEYNTVVNSLDFTIIKSNFGQAGHALTCP